VDQKPNRHDVEHDPQPMLGVDQGLLRKDSRRRSVVLAAKKVELVQGCSA